jgi:hypothetical protein
MRETFLLRSRRNFLGAVVGAIAATITDPLRLAGLEATSRGASEHPEPRPGIDGSKVLTAEQLKDDPDLIPLFDGIRKIPHIADGIRCSYGCAPLPEYRSLLTCYETGMATHCEVCQTEGRMVVRLHGNGRTLDQIRAALDARFG